MICGWLLTYLIPFPHMPALIVALMVQTAGYKIAALAVVVFPLWHSDIHFQQTGPQIDWKTAVSVLCSTPVDRACSCGRLGLQWCRLLHSVIVIIKGDTKQRSTTQCLSLSPNEYGEEREERDTERGRKRNPYGCRAESVAIYKKKGKCAIFLPNCRDLFLAPQKGKKTFEWGDWPALPSAAAAGTVLMSDNDCVSVYVLPGLPVVMYQRPGNGGWRGGTPQPHTGGPPLWPLLRIQASTLFGKVWHSSVQCCFTSTETVQTVTDREPMMATLTFARLLSSDWFWKEVIIVLGSFYF